MATTCLLPSTVQNVLNAQINIITLTEASNLDAVGQTGKGTVGPAATAVLRHVLVERMGQVRDTIDIRPGKAVR